MPRPRPWRRSSSACSRSAGDEDGASPPSTTAGAIPTDPFFEILSPPSDVAVVALGDGSFEVSYVAPEGVASVEIEYANGDAAEQIVSSNASPEVLAVRRPDAVRDAPLDRPGRAGVDRLRAGVLGLTVVVACHVTRNTSYSTPSVAIRPSARNTDVLSQA